MVRAKPGEPLGHPITSLSNSKPVRSAFLLGDSGPSVGALTLFFQVWCGGGLLTLGPALALAGGTAGSVSPQPAGGTGEEQLAAEVCGAQLVSVPRGTAVPTL